MDRRGFIGALGCSLAASPLVTPIAFASAPWDARLVVIVLRGAMDGLDVVQPYGDPAYSGLRDKLAGGPNNGALDLDGFYAAHPAMGELTPLWQAGELGFVHAVSTPYRDKRSHFDGQDILEAGVTVQGETRGGWLNRMLQSVPGITGETAFAIGREQLLIADGAAPVSRWAPDADLRLSEQAQRLLQLVHANDPLVHAASEEAIALAAAIERDASGDRVRPQIEMARFAASRLREDTRIATFSINGWDTHARQHNSMPRVLGMLSQVILELKTRLGDVWGKTALIAMTEFGRTVRENGSHGTDHGTAGAAILAGGAIRGGRVYGTWPGLEEADLYARRDLMPTADVRSYAAWIMQGLFGIGRGVLEGAVFPGLDMQRDPGVLA